MIQSTFLFMVFINTLMARMEQAMYILDSPEILVKPCNGSSIVTIAYQTNYPPEEENQYKVSVNLGTDVGPLFANSVIKIKLDADATVELHRQENMGHFARIHADTGGMFSLKTYRAISSHFSFQVKGMPGGQVPNLESININGDEFCKNPEKGILDEFIEGGSTIASSNIKPLPRVLNCGRQLVKHTALITHSAPTKPGDWPWHAAIYKLISRGVTQMFICGGTLVSKNIVVTASHCTTQNGINVIPETLKVVLGKYRLKGGDRNVQEMDVFEVIVHPEFDQSELKNDIALLRLASEAVFSDFIQPACLWDPTNTLISPWIGKLGTVVGWGIDETNMVADELALASVPIVSRNTCRRSLSSFFDKFLRKTTYCAGFRNGTSVCNGDSGGGMVFPIEVTPGDESSKTWFLRGVVSVGVSSSDTVKCDPNHYAVFTDAAKYSKWIELYVKNNEKNN